MHEILLHVSEDLVRRFAEFTGDRSSLHLDQTYARRTRHRRRIAHGMLPLAGLAAIQAQFPDQIVRFRRIEGRFLKPVDLGDDVQMRVDIFAEREDSLDFSATWSIGSTEVIRASGTCTLTPADRQPLGPVWDTSFSQTPLEELALGLDELPERSEQVSLELTQGNLRQFVLDVLVPMGLPLDSQPICPNLASTLMLSPLVGMRLPGRRATFRGFEIRFDRDVEIPSELVIEGRVSRVQEAAGIMKAEISIVDDSELASGSVDVLVNDPPISMPSVQEMRDHLDFGIAGRTAIVVGGSRGIGETTAKALAVLGAKVALTYHQGREDANRIVSDIKSHGFDAAAFQCDVRVDDHISSLVDDVTAELGPVTILVNSAVHRFTPTSLHETQWSDFLEELEVSLKGLHAMCRAVIPVMREQGGGKIINFSSVAVHNPVSGQSSYIAAKSAVEGYTKSLAKELMKDGIQVNVVVPAMTETDLVASIPSLVRERLGSSTNMGRNLNPAEVAQAVVFLASQWSNSMTGQALYLNAGEPPFA